MGAIFPVATKRKGRTSKPPKSPGADTIKGPSNGSIVEKGNRLRTCLCKGMGGREEPEEEGEEWEEWEE